MDKYSAKIIAALVAAEEYLREPDCRKDLLQSETMRLNFYIQLLNEDDAGLIEMADAIKRLRLSIK